MANEVKILITGDDRASAKLRGVRQEADGLGGTLKKLAPLALGAGAALAGGAILGKNFADAASDLNEALNKTSVVFGDSADVIQDFAKTSAKSFGISERAANEYAGTLGTILDASGLAEEASADMSVGMVKLASDLASFNNIPIDVALEKIRSGLVGEAEPLRTVGVLLSEAAVKTKAYELGIAAVGEELTEGQKVQARYALIMEQTATAQGDFARTSDGAANQQRILSARFEDLRAKIGQGLLPVMGQLLKALNEVADWIETKVIPAVKEWYEKHQPEIEAALQEFQRVMKEDVMPVLQDLGELAEEWFPRIQAIVEKVWPIIENTIVTTMKVIRDVINVVMALLHGEWGEAWKGIKQLGIDIFEGLVKDIQLKLGLLVQVVGYGLAVVWQAFKDLGSNIRQWISDVAGNLYEGGRQFVRQLWAGIQSMASWFVSQLTGWFNSIDLTPGFDIPGVPFLQGGARNFRGGLAVVGERGPELVALPRGADVYPHGTAPAGGNRWSINYGYIQNVYPNVRDPRGVQRELDRMLRGL